MARVFRGPPGSEAARSVALVPDVEGDGIADILIGAPNHDTDPLVDLFVGKAYLYRGTSTGLSATASWTAVGEGTGHYFGSSVATAGDVNGDGYSDVFVGAYGDATNTGKAYVYLGGSTGLSTATVWTNDLTHAYVHENSAYST